MNWIILAGLLVANIALLECRKIRRGKDNCVPMSNSTVHQRLKCKKTTQVLSNINFTSYVSGKEKCQDTGGCSGLQLEVLMSRNLCYWKNSCDIAYTNRTPIIKTSNRTCIGEFPSHLYVKYECTENSSVIFLQNDLDVNEDQQAKESDRGLIVSHIDFPWHYMKELDFRLTLRPSSPELTHLHLWRRHFELDDSDWLRVKRSEHAKWRNFKDVNGTIVGPSVDFLFKTFQGSYRAPGFIICYRWSEQSELASKDEICPGKKGGRKKRPGKSPRRRGRKENGRKNKNKPKRKNRRNKKRKGRKDGHI